jgi:N-acetylneuraminic acid mutarotase
MLTPRDFAAPCVFNNQLYVFGGEYQAGGFLTDANESYNLLSDGWTIHAPLPVSLAESGAVVVGEKIFVMGGAPQGPPWYDLTTVNIYDPVADSWSAGSPMLLPRSQSVTVEANGLVYVIGGQNNSNGDIQGDIQIYDPTQDKWAPGPTMRTVRASSCGAIVGNKIYIIGGFVRQPSPDGTFIEEVPLNTVEELDTTTMAWATKSPMPTARFASGASAIGGRIYVMGGSTVSASAVTTVEIYDPQTDSWCAGEPMPAPRSTFVAGAVSSDGTVPDTIIVSGGYSPFNQPRGDTIAFTVPWNNPPVAQCKNVTVSAGPSCTADASVDNGSYDPDSGDTIRVSQAPLGPYPLGTTTVLLTVTDNHCASSSCVATVTVIDTTPPVIACPANVTIGCSADLLAPATFAVTATDTCDPSPTVTTTPVSGAGFPVGTTIVNCASRDASGNQSTCSFTVFRAPLGFSGFLVPLGGADATGGSFASPLRTFKMGSTIPVKFTAACNGAAVLTGSHRLQVAKFSDATTEASPIDATPPGAANPGDQFSLTAGGQWQFNLDTKATGMSVGTWLFIATLSDGSQHSAWVQLK